MTQTLNVLSLIFGLGAWIVPFVALFRKSTSNNGYMLGSFALCTVSLCCQFIQLNYSAASANIADLTVTEVYEFLEYLGAPRSIIEKAIFSATFKESIRAEY